MAPSSDDSEDKADHGECCCASAYGVYDAFNAHVI
jgi:hypothetical protein